MDENAKVNAIVGANIGRLRKELGLTRVQLAAKVGMDDSYLGKMERGLRGTSPGNYELLARALRTTLGELFTPRSRRRSNA